MAAILDDDHLESLQCSECHKYLSVFPVKNHPATRAVTCGRCSGSDDDDGGVRSVMYELIAGRQLFRCVNRYEGCRTLLRPDETEAHEAGCRSGVVFRCPKCDDGVDMSALALLWHYKVRHPSSRLKGKRLIVEAPCSDSMLYVRDDVVFIVLVRLASGSDVLRLSAVTLTASPIADQTFFTVEGSVLNMIGRGRCESMDAFDGDYFAVRVAPRVPVEVTFDLEVSRPTEPYRVPSSVGKAVRKGPKRIAVPSVRDRLVYRSSDGGARLVSNNDAEILLNCPVCLELIGSQIYTGHYQSDGRVPSEILDKLALWSESEGPLRLRGG